MQILIVGAGALGGLIAARLIAAGCPVSLATRDAGSAAALKSSGLRVSGVGGPVSVKADHVATMQQYADRETFDLIVLATKAQDAIEVAASALRLLRDGGTLLPIQNGGVSEMLAARFGEQRVVGGLSNLGATMTSVGACEQRNAGHLLIGELAGGPSGRTERVREELARGVGVRITPNMRGAVWSKLLLNCSVTTIGAIAGRAMRDYVALPAGRSLFELTYREALTVALAAGAAPERMIVDPFPPRWNDAGAPPAEAHDVWLAAIVEAYGDLKPSMLQDFERHRPTEIEFINGYVVELGRRLGVAVPANTGIVQVVRAITLGELSPHPTLLERVLELAR